MSTNTGTKRKMRSITAIAMVLAMVLSLFGGISLLPTTAYAATNVEKANVICAQYPYMDAGCDFNSQPTEIINISLSDAQAFGNAVSCPTTYWVIVYAKDGDNIKWTSNGKTGEQTSTPVGSKIGAYYNLWAGDVFSLNNSNVDPNKDVTFYISKGLKSYSVTVAEDITNGTVTADKASAAENDTVTLTVTPAENYEIDSVSYNDGSDHVITPVESVYSFSMPASNVTVTATFKAATPAAYTVTYDANGATSGTVPTDSTSYDANASVTVLGNTGNLVKTDYTFAGWNMAADGTGTDYAADATFTITADTTLYAKWTANAATTYSVTYDANGATGGTVPTDSTSYDANASVTVLGNTGNLVKTDYTFAGWNTKADGTGTDYAAGDTFTITADTTLYAKWTANTITVTFSTSTDGKTINKDGVTCNNSFDSYNNLFMGGTFSTTLGNFTRIVVTAQDTDRINIDSNYNLIAGWSNNTWTGNASSVNFGTIMGNRNNVTIVFTITPVTTYTVTFNSKGGSDVTSASVAEGNKVTKPTNPTRDGYTFLGWSTEETSSTYYDFDTAVTSSFTLYAQWEKKVETGVSDTSDIAVAVEGLNDAIDTSDLTANQYVTSEIEVKNEAVSDVSTTVSNKVSEVKGTDSSITVNYLTIDISKIITTVNANGSTTDGTKTAVTELTKPIEVAIPNIDGDKVDIVREHVGTATQFTERNSRNTVPVSFVDGEYYYDKANKIVYIYSSKFSTYAILIKPANNTGGNTGGNPGGSSGGGGSTVTTYSISYDLDGGTLAKANPTSYTKDTATFTLNNPTKDGYTFKGWIGSDLSKATVTVTVKKGSTGNRVYKATWEKNSDSSSEEDSSPVTPNGKTEEQNALTLNAGLKVSQTGKKITVKFGKVAGATSYEVYVAYCGQKFPTKATATTKKNSVSITKLNGKKLNLKKNFKVVVVAKKSKAKLGKTITAHVVGRKNVKYTNAKSIKITSKTALTLKKGKKSQIKAKTILVDSKKKQLTDAHAKEFRYASSNKKVATVSKTGKITAKGKGTATIYVYSRNGYAKKVKVTVK